MIRADLSRFSHTKSDDRLVFLACARDEFQKPQTIDGCARMGDDLDDRGAVRYALRQLRLQDFGGGVPEKSCHETISFAEVPTVVSRSLNLRAGSVAVSIST